jgi:hypothetical protein
MNNLLCGSDESHKGPAEKGCIQVHEVTILFSGIPDKAVETKGQTENQNPPTKI